MGYPSINYTWKYKFIILSIILLFTCIFQYQIIKKERNLYKNAILKIQYEHIKQKNFLIDKIRNLEIQLNK